MALLPFHRKTAVWESPIRKARYNRIWEFGCLRCGVGGRRSREGALWSRGVWDDPRRRRRHRGSYRGCIFVRVSTLLILMPLQLQPVLAWLKQAVKAVGQRGVDPLCSRSVACQVDAVEGVVGNNGTRREKGPLMKARRREGSRGCCRRRSPDAVASPLVCVWRQGSRSRRPVKRAAVAPESSS